MFRVTECELTVKDGAMEAVMTMGGTGYLKLYMGTGAEAEEGDESGFIPYIEQADGTHAFKVPVEALDQEIACSAFSRKKEAWYDRVLVFQQWEQLADVQGDIWVYTLDNFQLPDFAPTYLCEHVFSFEYMTLQFQIYRLIPTAVQ